MEQAKINMDKFCTNCGKGINENQKFCINCGNIILDKKIGFLKKYFFKIKKGKLIVFGGIFLILLFFVSIYFYINKQNISTDKRDENIASSVVNIYCEGALGWDGEGVSGGSGTIITEDGLVLTNAHIIPSGENASINEKSCIVVLPDPTTGAAKEIYYAKPIVFPDISEKYDLAYIEIDDVYYDEEEGKAYGEYPKKFPAYNSDLYCKNENVKLGEPVRIYGYPAISGGYALTITDGIVSSLLIEEGLIVTSAKISHGNSGGLAVDGNGCMIGIPSMFRGDEAESLGVIISNNLISNFNDEVEAIIN